MKKKILKVILLFGAMALVACGSKENGANTGTTAENIAKEMQGEKTDKHINVAISFAYPSIDPHKEYYGWYTSIAGITETLFKINEDLEVEPWIAKEVAENNNEWNIILNDNVYFSNGKNVNADMVVRNIKRVASENPRFAYLADFEMEVISDYEIKISKSEPYPTLVNELASPELAIIDLDETQDISTNPIATGPFKVENFIPESEISLIKNESYWNGDVKLDSAKLISLKDDDTKLLAMQNGEIDAYTGVNAAALEIYKTEPDIYKIEAVPSSRLQFYILNANNLDKDLRLAINKSINKEEIAAFLGETVTATESAFSNKAAYGKSKDLGFDIDSSKAHLETAGYTLNSKGFYEKDGKEINLNICYYNARSLDTVATLMKEQLAKVGINSTLTAYEDPDSTYMSTGEFDIGLYSMISDKAGDPYYFIKSTIKNGEYFDIAGFDNDKTEELIAELETEMDKDKRAEFANEIIQIAIDEAFYNYIGLFNKNTVSRVGVVNISEDVPFDFYFLNENTDIE